MTLLEELKWRNFIQDTTIEDLTNLNKTAWKFYIGFDASAPSQTIGNLASMMVAQTFLRHNHQAIILAGGATSLIGDPGGKEAERQLQDKQVIAKNISNAQAQFKTIFKDFESQITYVNNLNWYEDFKVLDFLRDVGKHFSMTPLIQRDYIASRLGEAGTGISYAEFSYSLLQGYDYLKLFEDYNCNLQIGGSDQWGNCLSGVDLVRKKHKASVDVITIPLIINKATGKKFGKSEEQTIWLDPKLTHPSDFFQFWLNTADEDVIDYLKVFTNLSKDEIVQIEIKHKQNMALRLGQIQLAEKTTKLVHGTDNLSLCKLFAQLAFKSSLSFSLDEVNQLLKTQADDQVINIESKQSMVNLDEIFNQIHQKIPTIESKAQVKKLYNSQAIKLVILQTDAEELSWQSLSLNEICEQKLWPQNTSTVALIILGKNTMRAVKYINNS